MAINKRNLEYQNKMASEDATEEELYFHFPAHRNLLLNQIAN